MTEAMPTLRKFDPDMFDILAVAGFPLHRQGG